MHDWNSTFILSARHSCMQSGKCIVVQQSSAIQQGTKKNPPQSYNVKITRVTPWECVKWVWIRLPLQSKCVHALKTRLFFFFGLLRSAPHEYTVRHNSSGVTCRVVFIFLAVGVGGSHSPHLICMQGAEATNGLMPPSALVIITCVLIFQITSNRITLWDINLRCRSCCHLVACVETKSQLAAATMIPPVGFTKKYLT